MLKGKAKKEDYNFIMYIIQSKLAGWKNKLLNRAGRLTQATSALNFIPSYYMQNSCFPQNVCDAIYRSVKDFIWKGNASSCLPLVGWNKVSRPNRDGGLGVRPTRLCNIALLGKMVWDLTNSPNKLWVQLISQNYCGREEFINCKMKKGSNTWLSVLKARQVLQQGFSF